MQILFKGLWRRQEDGKYGWEQSGWKDVDTTNLFQSMYNITVKDRYGKDDVAIQVYDKDVLAVRDDARIGKGRCVFCGAIIEDAEEHFKEMEAIKSCDTCYWWQKVLKSQTKETSERQAIDEKSRPYTEFIENQISVYVEGCTHGTCEGSRHREHGVTMFDADNTFFIRYPNGIPTDEELVNSVIKDFEAKWLCDDIKEANTLKHPKKFGSYTLEYYRPNEKFCLSNARNGINFKLVRHENGFEIVSDSWNTMKQNNKLIADYTDEPVKCSNEVGRFLENATGLKLCKKVV